MRALVLAALAVAGLAVTVQNQPPPPKPPAPPAPPEETAREYTDRLERPFVQNGQIAMDLSAGGYEIHGWPDPRIRVSWGARNPSEAKDVRVSAEISGTTARLVTDGPHNGFHARLDVPVRSNLAIELSAGDLNLEGVHGHTDVSAWAGKLTIGVAAPAEYKIVSASVTAGQIRAEPFHVEKGGLFRSFTWEGKGTYELRIRLTAGDVILHTNPQ